MQKELKPLRMNLNVDIDMNAFCMTVEFWEMEG